MKAKGERLTLSQPNWPGAKRRPSWPTGRSVSVQVAPRSGLILIDLPRAAKSDDRLDDPDPEDDPHEGGGHGDPQPPLPRAGHVVVHQLLVDDGSHHRDRGQHGVAGLPELVADAKPSPPYGCHHHQHQTDDRDQSKPGPPRGGDRIEQPEEPGVHQHDEHDRVAKNEQGAGIRDLAMKLHDRVLAEWSGDRPESRHQGELQLHHGQPHEPQGDRELGPEGPACWWRT